MHMIGISGRCAVGARAPPAASTPSPSTPAHVEGAHCVSKRKTGCHVGAEPNVLGGRILYAVAIFNPSFEAAADPVRCGPEALPCRSIRSSTDGRNTGG